MTWLRHFARPASINYIKITSENEVVGYFPLIYSEEELHRINCPTLSFAGNRISPIRGPVLDKHRTREIIRFFVKEVLPQSPWVVLRGLEMAEELPGFHELVEEARTSGYGTSVEPGKANWIYECDEPDFDRYLASRREDVRRTIKKQTKRLGEIGRIDYRLVTTPFGSSDLEAYFDVLARSWKLGDGFELFNRDLLVEEAKRNLLRLGFLSLNEKDIATHLFFIRQRRAYGIVTAYDEDFKQYAPGVLLAAYMVEQLMKRDRCIALDFLHGDHEYKRVWSSERRVRQCVTIFGRNATGRLLYNLDHRILPLIRSVPALERAKRRLFKPRRNQPLAESERRKLTQSLEQRLRRLPAATPTVPEQTIVPAVTLVWAETRYVMLIYSPKRRLDPRALRRLLAESDLRLANKQEVLNLTGVDIPLVSPFGSIYGITTYCDDALYDSRLQASITPDAAPVELSWHDYETIERPEIYPFTLPVPDRERG